MMEKIKELLDHAEDRKAFFRRISHFLPASDPRYKEIEKAYNCAKDGFRGRYRTNGEKYFEHLRAVALILIEYLRIKDHELIIAAFLHDIVEDLPSWTVERVRTEFGERVALLVDWLTKPSPEEFDSKEERDRVYFERFALAEREFFLIKLADRLHNLITMWSFDKERKQRKIKETRTYFLPNAEKHFILLHELEEALNELESS